MRIPFCLWPYRRAGLWAALMLLWIPGAASAQMFTYGGDRSGPSQSLAVGYYLINFEFDGDEEPTPSFDFVDPAYGFVYSRPNFLVTFAFGNQGAGDGRDELRLVDASFFVWGGFQLLRGDQERRVSLYIPILLHSSYRRVSRDAPDDEFLDAFDFAVIGLGSGLGFRGGGKGWVVEARATPILGLAVRSFGDTTGSARILDTDVQIHFDSLFSQFGLTLGYGYRLQAWNIGASNLFPNITNDLFDYSGNQQLFRVGINW